MLQTWTVEAPARTALPASAVAALLEADAEVAPAATMLALLNSVVAVDHLTLLHYAAGSAPRPPQLLEGVALRPAARDTPGTCFDLYRRHYWRCDEATQLAEQLGRRSLPVAAVTALRMRRPEIPLAAWRSEIYERAALADRLSFLYTLGRDQVFALNLYRDTAVGAFRPSEIDSLLGLAPLLRRLHQRAGHVPAGHDVDAAARQLARRVPALSARELQVCARIACGISVAGIAVDLDIAPSTVDTLRKRAYAKLAQARLPTGRLALAHLLR